jgi:hypothetical protein
MTEQKRREEEAKQQREKEAKETSDRIEREAKANAARIENEAKERANKIEKEAKQRAEATEKAAAEAKREEAWQQVLAQERAKYDKLMLEKQDLEKKLTEALRIDSARRKNEQVTKSEKENSSTSDADDSYIESLIQRVNELCAMGDHKEAAHVVRKLFVIFCI